MIQPPGHPDSSEDQQQDSVFQDQQMHQHIILHTNNTQHHNTALVIHYQPQPQPLPLNTQHYRIHNYYHSHHHRQHHKVEYNNNRGKRFGNIKYKQKQKILYRQKQQQKGGFVKDGCELNAVCRPQKMMQNEVNTQAYKSNECLNINQSQDIQQCLLLKQPAAITSLVHQKPTIKLKEAKADIQLNLQTDDIMLLAIDLAPKKHKIKRKDIQKLTMGHPSNNVTTNTTQLTNILQDVSQLLNQTKQQLQSFYKCLIAQTSSPSNLPFQKIKLLILSNEMVRKVKITQIRFLPLDLDIKPKKNNYYQFIKFTSFSYQFQKEYKQHQQEITLAQLILPPLHFQDKNTRLLSAIVQLSKFRLKCTSCEQESDIFVKETRCELSCGNCLNRMWLQIKQMSLCE